MCIEMCIVLILEHVEMALSLALLLVVLFPSPPQVEKIKKVFSVSNLNSYLFNLLRSSTIVIRP